MGKKQWHQSEELEVPATDSSLIGSVEKAGTLKEVGPDIC